MDFTGKADPALLAALLDDAPGTRANRLRSIVDAARSRAAIATNASKHRPGPAFDAKVASRVREKRATMTTEQNRRTADIALEPEARAAERLAERTRYLDHAKTACRDYANARALATALREELRKPRLPKATGDPVRDLTTELQRHRISTEVQALTVRERLARLRALPNEPSIEAYELEAVLQRDKGKLHAEPDGLGLLRQITLVLKEREDARVGADAEMFREAETVLSAAAFEIPSLTRNLIILSESQNMNLPEDHGPAPEADPLADLGALVSAAG